LRLAPRPGRHVSSGSRAGIACTRSACPLYPRIAVEVVALPKLSRRCREQTIECCNQVQALLATTKNAAGFCSELLLLNLGN
jgi:hypothetical protein